MRIRLACLLSVFEIAACHKGSSIASTRREWPGSAHQGYINPIPAENAQLGDVDWSSGPAATGHALEGYGDRISAAAEDHVSFYVSSDQPTTFTWTLYRFGWYGGAGARAVAHGGPVGVSPQRPCLVETGTGLVQCHWNPSLGLDITDDFVSGLYALKLVRKDGKIQFIPLIVKDARPADLLFQASIQTYAAYNTWGGESLYTDDAGATRYGHAVKVSLDRPFNSGRGLGQMPQWELPMARFLERNGYDVSYSTNIDVSVSGPSFVSRAGMFLSVGHDEYWTGAERETIDRVRGEGVPLAFFSANTAYWKVRYEDSPSPDNPRVITCYKDGDDPLGGESTGLFRGNEIGEPENELLGVMYESWQLFGMPFIAGDEQNWLYEGTGLKRGDAIPGIVGHEYDHRFANGVEPAQVTVLARSPVVDNRSMPGWSEATAYRTPNGGFVFAAGTIYWARGLDEHAVPDERIARMTANVFHEALGLTVPNPLAAAKAPSRPTPVFGAPSRTVSTVATGLVAPSGIALVPKTASAFAGQLIVAATGSPQVLAIDPVTGNVTVVAGDGTRVAAAAYNDVPGSSARFNAPVGVAVDADGRIYVTDSAASIVAKIDNDPARTTSILAGAVNAMGRRDGVGKMARFSRPSGIAFDPTSGVLYVADTGNSLIRAVDPLTGAVSTVSGTVTGDQDGPSARCQFDWPTGVSVAPDGRIFVLSSQARKVKQILPDTGRTVVTIAGGGEGASDGVGTAATFSAQLGAAWSGNALMVADLAGRRLRQITPSNTAAGTKVETFAFSGDEGSSDGAAQQATIMLPLGVATDGTTVYVTDGAAGTVRAVR